MTSASTEETPTDPVAHGEAAGREPWWKRLPWCGTCAEAWGCSGACWSPDWC